MSVLFVRGWRGLALALCAAVMMLSPASGPTAQSSAAALAGPAPGGPELRSRRALDVGEGREAGVRHLRHAALDAERRSLLVHLPDPRRPPVLHRRSAEEGEGAALRSREDGRGADVDHAAALRRAAPAVLQHQVQERQRVRVRRLGPARRRHRHDQEEDHDDARRRAAGGRATHEDDGRRSAAAGTARRRPRDRAAHAAAQPQPAVRVRPDDREP